MRIDITPALKNSDVRIPLDYDVDLSELMLSFGEKAIGEPVHVHGEIKGRYNATWLDMQVHGTFLFSCDRCGKEFRQIFEYPFHAMLTTDVQEVDSEELVVAEGGFLDIEGVAGTVIALSAPSKHLCSEDCKGLCLLCGQDLNLKSCDCSKKKIDPRLAGLAKFFEE